MTPENPKMQRFARSPRWLASALGVSSLTALLALPALAAGSPDPDTREPLGAPGRPYLVHEGTSEEAESERTARPIPVPGAVKRALEADRKKQEDMPVGRPAPPLQVRRIDPE